MARIIEKPSAWIIRALGLRPGQASETLADESVPVVDTLQGGHGLGAWTMHRIDTTNWGASVTLDILTTNVNATRLVQTAIGRRGGALATAGDITWLLRPELFTTSAAQMRLASLPIGQAISFDQAWADLGQGSQSWIVPPGWTLHIQIPASDGITDRLVINTAILEVPAGTKPG